MQKPTGETGKVIPLRTMLSRLESMGGESVSVRSFAMQFTNEGDIYWAVSMADRLVRAGYARVVQTGDKDAEVHLGWVKMTPKGRLRLEAVRAAERQRVTGGAHRPQTVRTGSLSGRQGASYGE